MMSALIDLLTRLVRIPSPNPPGDTTEIAAFIADTLRAAGCAVTTAAPPQKPEAVSVIAAVGGGEPTIMLHAHIDTVPIDDDESRRWSVDPYAGVVKDGKVYGKGAVDDKAPLAAMMRALIEAAARPALCGTLVLVAAAEEEVGGRLGTRWLAENGHCPTCDFIIVGEQTGNRPAAAHKGVLRASVRTIGRSVHATNPNRGVNAITAMARLVLAFETYHRGLAARQHPLAGSPTCNIGVIRGGSTANAVPDSCEIQLDRRMIPGEAPSDVERELRAVIDGVDITPASAELGGLLVSDWFESKLASPLAAAFKDAIRAEGIDPTPTGYLPGSDAKHLKGALSFGGEIVVFGPGSYEVAHAYDEYVEVAGVEQTARILMRFIDSTLLDG